MPVITSLGVLHEQGMWLTYRSAVQARFFIGSRLFYSLNRKYEISGAMPEPRKNLCAYEPSVFSLLINE